MMAPLVLLILLLGLLCLLPQLSAESSPPLVTVFTFADDFGSYQAGFRGNSEARTPTIDEYGTAGLLHALLLRCCVLPHPPCSLVVRSSAVNCLGGSLQARQQWCPPGATLRVQVLLPLSLLLFERAASVPR
jgi:hypothetical protein